MQVQAEPLDEALDVVHCLLRVPAGVDVKDYRPEPEFGLREIGEVGAIDSATDTNETIVGAILSVTFDLLDDALELCGTPLIRVPVRLDVLVEIDAVVA